MMQLTYDKDRLCKNADLCVIQSCFKNMTDIIAPVNIKTEPIEVEIELIQIKEEYIDSDYSEGVNSGLEKQEIEKKDDDSHDSDGVKNEQEKQDIERKEDTTSIDHEAGSSNNKDLLIAVNAKNRILRTRKKTYVTQEEVLSDNDNNNTELEKPRFLSRRGNSMMVINKYTYSVEVKRKISGDKTEILWFCFNGRPTHCQAKAYTIDEKVVRVTGTHNHNHKRKYKKKSEKETLNDLKASINSCQDQDSASTPKKIDTNNQSPEHSVDTTPVSIKIEPDLIDEKVTLNIKPETIEIEINPLSYDTTEPDKSAFGIPISNHKNDPFLPLENPSFSFSMDANTPFQENLFSVQTADSDKAVDEWAFDIAMHDCLGKECTRSLDGLNIGETVSRNHENTKQMFFCEDCRACFSRQRLIRHRCNKLYPCNICCRKLINKYSSIIHVSTHKNENRGLFHCKACGATFAMERHLKTHVTRVHNRK